MSVHRSHPRHDPVVTQDRAQRHDSGAAGEEQERSAERGLPDEVAAEGTAQLQLVAQPKLVDQVRRNLTVVQTLDGEHDVLRGQPHVDVLAAMRLVAVLRGQPHVDVLIGAMSRPVWQLESDALRPGGLFDELDDGSQVPGQSPL